MGGLKRNVRVLFVSFLFLMFLSFCNVIPFLFCMFVFFFSMTFVLCKNVDDNCAPLVPPPPQVGNVFKLGGGKGVQVDER